MLRLEHARSAADCKHAYWRFLNRLPDVPCTAWTPDGDKNVEEGLSELALQLGHRTDNQPVVNWIDTIAEEMDYDEWLKKQDPRVMKIQGEPGCQALRLAVGQFRRQAEDE